MRLSFSLSTIYIYIYTRNSKKKITIKPVVLCTTPFNRNLNWPRTIEQTICRWKMLIFSSPMKRRGIKRQHRWSKWSSKIFSLFSTRNGSEEAPAEWYRRCKCDQTHLERMNKDIYWRRVHRILYRHIFCMSLPNGKSHLCTVHTRSTFVPSLRIYELCFFLQLSIKLYPFISCYGKFMLTST